MFVEQSNARPRIVRLFLIDVWKCCATRELSAAIALLALVSLASAQSFKTLTNFNVTNGADPYGALVQGTSGDLYGTTRAAGPTNNGIVFKISTVGVSTVLYNFCIQTNCTDGAAPTSPVVLGTDGNFYGTTLLGGTNGYGTIFKVTPSGTLTTLHSFTNTDGASPYAALVQGTDGSFYGTTFSGGTNQCVTGGCGTVFKITPGGTFSSLHSFDGTSGANPNGALVQGSDGNFYGTTVFGGVGVIGTIFKITPNGTFTNLHTFASPEGSYPYAGLAQGNDGNFYGTTEHGGNAPGYGTFFKIAPNGSFKTIHMFTSLEPANPYASLLLATDGNFYGTTIFGGTANLGTAFEITPQGKVTALHSFDGSDGQTPYGGLVQSTNGNFYGNTSFGGSAGIGTVFGISTGIGSFVETVPSFGKAGNAIKILGTGLTGATAVTFNGTPTSFTVVSPSLINTNVPPGATSGTVQVTTSKGILSSNVVFRVR